MVLLYWKNRLYTISEVQIKITTKEIKENKILTQNRHVE